MEPWKVILMVAAVPTLIAAVLSGMNNSSISALQAESGRKQNLVEQKKSDLTTLQDKLVTATNETTAATAETTALTAELDEAEALIAEKDVEIQAKTTQVADSESKIKMFDDLVNLVGEINKVTEIIATKKMEVDQIGQEVTRANNQFAIVDAHNQDQLREIGVLEGEAANRKRGGLPRDVTSHVKQAFNDWGFVVIGAGDVEGMVPNAVLEVTRQGKPICKVVVTEVEPSQAVADIIPSSLTPGQLVQVNDQVIGRASANLPVAVPGAAPMGAPAAPPAPAAADPFGMGAPAAPAAPDPFGGMGGAAPAAPAAPAGGMAPDPFAQ